MPGLVPVLLPPVLPLPGLLWPEVLRSLECSKLQFVFIETQCLYGSIYIQFHPAGYANRAIADPFELVIVGLAANRAVSLPSPPSI